MGEWPFNYVNKNEIKMDINLFSKPWFFWEKIDLKEH